jgi:hypothetical protein
MTDSDQAFLQALEACVQPEADFRHAAHVRAAYLYLRAGEFASALPRRQRAIRAYASSLGRLRTRQPELFDKDLLLQFYSRSQLESGLARRLFLLPESHRRDAEVNAGPPNQAGSAGQAAQVLLRRAARKTCRVPRSWRRLTQRGCLLRTTPHRGS